MSPTGKSRAAVVHHFCKGFPSPESLRLFPGSPRRVFRSTKRCACRSSFALPVGYRPTNGWCKLTKSRPCAGRSLRSSRRGDRKPSFAGALHERLQEKKRSERRDSSSSAPVAGGALDPRLALAVARQADANPLRLGPILLFAGEFLGARRSVDGVGEATRGRAGAIRRRGSCGRRSRPW
jgi:hypothetical protein